MQSGHMIKRRSYLTCAIMLALGIGVVPDPVVADTFHFTLKAYRITGPALLSPRTTERLLKPYTGRNQSIGIIESARAALQKAYRNAGYSAVAVVLPPQKLNSGVVVLHIVAPRLEDITVHGGPYYNRGNVLASLPALQLGKIPNERDINENLTMANTNPSKHTVVRLSKGQRKGTIAAHVSVQGQVPWHAFMTLDNTGDPETGRLLLSAGLQYANIANRDQVLTLQYTTSPNHFGKMDAYGLGYHVPIYRWNGSFNVFGGYSNINAGTIDQVFDITGKGIFLGFNYNQYLLRTAHYQQVLTFGFDYTAFRNNITYEGVPIGNNVTIHPVSVSYYNRFINGNNALSGKLALVQNIPWGANGDLLAFQKNRAGAVASYHLVRIRLTYSHFFTGNWELQAKASGQYSPDALISGAQFGLGGLHSTRGFFQRQYTGDSGAEGVLAFYTPNFGRTLGLPDTLVRALTFYDNGWAWLQDPQPGDTAYLHIASVGVGLNMLVASHLLLRIDYAHILNSGSLGPYTSNQVQGSLALAF